MRTVSMLMVLLLAGCATAAPAVTRFDGRYVGTETPDTSDPVCTGAPRPIVFDVVGDTIRLRTHARYQLDGNVHADGSIEMADGTGENEITGAIRDGRLSANASSRPPHGRRVHADDASRPACLSTIDAVLQPPDR
ncbi:hypothetical protein [Lichenicola sp.]|uniref:hypothetical protein n=1 Tax=Lichenicola sp. TaxID=2804529 RepID=UPI003AFF9840